MNDTDARYMKLALGLAAKGAGWVSPNPMVGAVVVREGRIAGRGWHRAYGRPHAEVEALRQAGATARGADLYVTLEPCNHQGRTPPCTRAVLDAGVRRVVMATRDPNPRVNGGGAEFLQERGLEVEIGLLAAAARRLNEAWFKWVATGLPFVIAKAAASLDGKIATATGESQWLTGEKARAFGHRLRHEVDAILVGAGTALADDPQLTVRLPAGTGNQETRKTAKPGKDPIRIVLDSRLRLPLEARMLHLDSPAPTWVACTPAAPPARVKAIQDLGAEVLILPGATNGMVALPPLLAELGRRRSRASWWKGAERSWAPSLTKSWWTSFIFSTPPRFWEAEPRRGCWPARGSSAWGTRSRPGS